MAYVEVETFGGWGTQASVVWESGEIVLGPLYQDCDSATYPEWPANRALRRLGVIADGHDKFDALTLGRHRETADWL